MIKSVVITGVSSGFGRGMVDEFLQRGWQVIATMRNVEIKRELLAAPLAQYGEEQLTLLNLDLTDSEQVKSVINTVLNYGSLNCLIHNAAFRVFGALENLSEAEIRHQFEVNFFGAVSLTQAFLPLLRQSQGSIIFISSTFGFCPYPLTSAHCASKHALEGFAESLYYELQPHGVDVAIIEPGASQTNSAQNRAWGAGDSPTYQLQTANYQKLQQRITGNAADNTPIVARRAADIAAGKRHPFRSRVGTDAEVIYLLQKFLPQRLRIPLANFIYKSLFCQEVK